HEDLLAVLAHELVDDLLRGLPVVGELEHALVHRGTRGAVEIGSAAGVDVLVAPARALELLLDRLDRGVVVTGGHGGKRATGARGVPQPARRSGARERILGGLADRRSSGQKQPAGRGYQELTPRPVRPTA